DDRRFRPHLGTHPQRELECRGADRKDDSELAILVFLDDVAVQSLVMRRALETAEVHVLRKERNDLRRAGVQAIIEGGGKGLVPWKVGFPLMDDEHRTRH